MLIFSLSSSQLLPSFTLAVACPSFFLMATILLSSFISHYFFFGVLMVSVRFLNSFFGAFNSSATSCSTDYIIQYISHRSPAFGVLTPCFLMEYIIVFQYAVFAYISRLLTLWKFLSTLSSGRPSRFLFHFFRSLSIASSSGAFSSSRFSLVLFPACLHFVYYLWHRSPPP